ncbi:hypothetical protein EDB85DRAFT_2154154 [Lactarius pseudohatsudake]|nr:hypothetical protein EDB85DRAFT_2154154 [Lactarius pseudohatsudake]
MAVTTVVWTSRPSHNAGITQRRNRKVRPKVRPIYLGTRRCTTERCDLHRCPFVYATHPGPSRLSSPLPARGATFKGIAPSCLNLKAIGLPARDAEIVPGTSCLLLTRPPSHPLAKCTVADLKAIAHDAGVAPRNIL